MNHIFSQSLDKMNKTKTLAHKAYVGLSVLRAAAVGVMVAALWNDVDPTAPLLHTFCGIATFISVLRFSSLSRYHSISQSSLLLSLDMQYPAAGKSPFLAAESDQEAEDWQARLTREENKLRTWEFKRLTTLAGSVAIPMLVAGLLLVKAPLDLAAATADARTLLTAITGGMTLEVIEGAAPLKTKQTSTKEPIKLSTSSPPTVELIPSNLLKLTIVRVESSTTPPVINLKPLGNTPPITIQMSPAGPLSTRQNIWSAEFSAGESSELIIPVISSKPAAKLVVAELPTPKVQLSFDQQGRDPWPDHELLPLNVQVSSVHPLEKVLLKIITKKKTYEESVVNISGSTTTVQTSYKLNLQPWMEEDIVEFDIVAEATDRAEPEPLTGKSPPIHVKVASAYGRYKQALETLRKLKSVVDDSRSSGQKPPANAEEIMRSVLKQSEETPFFDGMDRVQLAQISQKLANTLSDPSTAKVQELADEVGDFLLEHEILDDRERDRDLFIAIRAYSRTLDKPLPERTLEAEYLTTRMLTFLDDRHKRWAMRVKFLGPANTPSSWDRINQQKPFKSLAKRALSDAEANPKKAQGHLSSLASDYRSWIEELEAKEDQLRAKLEKERQQGLANARNDLRELQQRQDQISTYLDRAPERTPDVESKWPSSRMAENSNAKQAKGLLDKLRSLDPTAGDRLAAAIKAMELTLSSGDGSKWVEAESASDLAGRLLRDADQAASKSQKQQGRGRRRRSTGDEYYGTAIGGQVEIKSEYRVDPRYREDILRDVESEISNGEDKAILDGWLHEVVR